MKISERWSLDSLVPEVAVSQTLNEVRGNLFHNLKNTFVRVVQSVVSKRRIMIELILQTSFGLY